MEQRQEARGFTMIELLMVVTIIGILLAVAVPTFLGMRRGANDRAAQTVVRHLLVSARAVATDGEDASTIQTGEPAVKVVAPSSVGRASSSEVSVRVDGRGRSHLRDPRVAVDVRRLLRDPRARGRLDRSTSSTTPAPARRTPSTRRPAGPTNGTDAMVLGCRAPRP